MRRAAISSRRKLPLELILVAAAAIGLACYIHLSSRNIAENDSLYHLRHAAIYRSSGVLYHQFPWTAYSIIKRYAADVWYGFHLVLIPATFIQNPPILAEKVAGIYLLVALLLAAYFTVSRCQVALAWLWPFMLVFTLSGRMVQVRPQVLSTALTAILVPLMVSGGVAGVFVTSLLLAFIHLAFFWLAILVAVTVVAVKWRTERVLEWRKIGAVLVGVVAGWLLRPNPMGAVRILYVQTIQVAALRGEQLLPFGRELYPLDKMFLLWPVFGPDTYGIFLAVWLCMVALFLRTIFSRRAQLSPRPRTLLWSTLLLSVLFFEITFLLYARSLDQWVLFGVLFIAGSFTYLLRPKAIYSRQLFRRGGLPVLGRLGALGFAGLLLACMAVGTARVVTCASSSMIFNPYSFRPAAMWLKAHARPDEIVFHTNWGHFPGLFFWNPRNRYIGGMDPIFQYAYDQDLYWKAYHLWTGEAAGYTWGTRDYHPSKREDTYIALTRDFKASYVFLIPRGFPVPGSVQIGDLILYSYLRSDPRFALRFRDQETAVFEILKPRVVVK